MKQSVCLRVCVCVLARVCVRVRGREHTSTSKHAHVSVSLRVFMSLCVCVFVLGCTSKYVHLADTIILSATEGQEVGRALSDLSTVKEVQ